MDDLNGNHSKMFLNANVTISSEKDQDEEALVDSTLVPLVGKRLIYMYENGWEYEVYYKNKSNIDYKVLKGMVAGRCVNNQVIHMRRLSATSEMFMVNWTEPTGTCVCQVVDLDRRSMQSVIFFPHWVVDNPSKTVLFQNDHLPIIATYRDVGPTYPIRVVNESGFIHTILNGVLDNERHMS